MKLELSMVIFGLILILLVVGPLYYYHKMQKNKRKLILNNFILLGKNHEMTFSDYDLWDHGAIGLDPVLHKLLYINRNDLQQKEVMVDLRELSRCEISQSMRRTASKGSTVSVTDRLEIICKHREPSIPDRRLVFYNAENNCLIQNEIQLINKWCDLMNKLVKR